MHPQNVMKRRLFSLLLTLAMLLSLLPAAHALGEEKLPDEDGYGYTYRFVTRDTIEITSYSGYESEVVVPATIDGYTVVGIQSFHATEGYSDPNVVVRKVTLPDTVTYIADDAFYDSDDWSAKTHSALREIVLPQSLKTIGERAFYHNYYLEKITIPASVTEIGKARLQRARICPTSPSRASIRSCTAGHSARGRPTASAPLPGSSARFTMIGFMTTVRRTSSSGTGSCSPIRARARRPSFPTPCRPSAPTPSGARILPA